MEFSARFVQVIHTEESLEAVTRAIDWIEQYVNDFGIALVSLAQGKLPPSMFPSDALENILTKISQVLPRGWSLTALTKAGELWHFYDEAKVTTARTPSGLRLFIQFPIVETGATFDLFHIISVAQPVGNGSYAQRFTPLPACIVISENRQLFAELQAKDAGECLTPSPALCRLYAALSHCLSKRTCIMAIFNADRKLISSDCTTLIEKWPGPEMRYIGNRKWAYTTTADQQIQFSCVLEQQHELTRILPAVGVLELPDGCTATADHWILPANIHQLLEQQQQQQVVTSPPFSFTIVQQSTAPISLTMPPILPSRSDPILDSVLRRNAQAMDYTRTTEQRALDLEEDINADFPAEWKTASTIAFLLPCVYIFFHSPPFMFYGNNRPCNRSIAVNVMNN